MFTTRSRYAAVADATYQDPSGRQSNYKVLRITPATSAIQTHTVAQGDRLDLLGFQYYSDSEQFWRICDGNNALFPDDLTETVGVRILIPVVQR
jgi:hypothetical protein